MNFSGGMKMLRPSVKIVMFGALAVLGSWLLLTNMEWSARQHKHLLGSNDTKLRSRRLHSNVPGALKEALYAISFNAGLQSMSTRKMLLHGRLHNILSLSSSIAQGEDMHGTETGTIGSSKQQNKGPLPRSRYGDGFGTDKSDKEGINAAGAGGDMEADKQQPNITQPPKVALLFLVQDRVIHEAVWRAFFENAGTWTIPGFPSVDSNPDDFTDLMRSRDNVEHPPLHIYPDIAYPGYRLQHQLGEDGEPLHQNDRGLKGNRDSGAATWQVTTSPDQPKPVLDLPSRSAQSDSDRSQSWKHRRLRTYDLKIGSTHNRRTSSKTHRGFRLRRGERKQVQAEMRRLLGPALARMDTISSQRLFSVYVHNKLGSDLHPGSVFHGHEIPKRVNTTNGYAQHVLTEAMICLLEEALKNPLNSKFAFISDSSIPLYPPQVVYAQLMSEERSRVNACPGDGMNLYRWRPIMQTDRLNATHWRKSDQWMVLSRAHALLATADKHVREVFHRHCYTNSTGLQPVCVSDEHYVPTLLASYHLDNQTDCHGHGHFVEWVDNGWHPRKFKNVDITSSLPAHLRHVHWAPEPCHAQAALTTAAAIYGHDPERERRVAETLLHQRVSDYNTSALHFRQLTSNPLGTMQKESSAMHPEQQTSPALHKLSGNWVTDRGYSPLASHCPLFARKFAAGAQRSVLRMALSCRGLGLGAWCRHNQPANPKQRH